ncbi:hypothetical protein [Lyngbya confervoides]|uniref:Uncharacterized protein n=1 Tax=Lyngbya confervoides BDU141951 TaxID=1574623 RepID=A0ABD4SY68_9CYAN|nr:hypothetical protein [Lyngbya confervoides]MCM1981292.1 hypothetical protein [Lyngbya confervoides BDU141951]
MKSCDRLLNRRSKVEESLSLSPQGRSLGRDGNLPLLIPAPSRSIRRFTEVCLRGWRFLFCEVKIGAFIL